jgi:hypothetical protein
LSTELVASRRTLALTNGAQFMPAKQQAKMRIEKLKNTFDYFESDEAP